MPRTDAFETHTDRYERWFEQYDHAYRSELRALGRIVPQETNGIEIGVGTGRFAEPLGIQTGIDPSEAMVRRAADRGIEVIKGVAESLPVANETYETALIVTTICFVDDIDRTLAEARRILKPKGRLVLGYIDKDTPVGTRYQERKDESPFYKDATFVSTADFVERLDDAGFGDKEFVQTMFQMPENLSEPDRVTKGYGIGSFVGIEARR